MGAAGPQVPAAAASSNEPYGERARLIRLPVDERLWKHDRAGVDRNV